MRSGRAVLAAALAATALYLGSLAAADVAVRRHVHRMLAEHPDWRVERICVAPWSDRVRLYGLRGSFGQASVSIGSVDLPLGDGADGLLGSAQAAVVAKPEPKPSVAPPMPPPRPGPDLSAPKKPVDTAAADDVVIASGSTTYRIKHIALTGTKLSDADLATLLDLKTATTLEARLKTVSAASIEIPEIVADDPTVGSRRHWSATKILFANVVAGKAGAGSASMASLSVTQGGETVEGTIGAVQGTGLDLPQIAHVLGTQRSDDKEAALPLGETFGIETIKLANAGMGTSVALATLQARGLTARPLQSNHAAADGAAVPGRPTLFEDVTHSFATRSIEAGDFAAAHKAAGDDSTFGAKRVVLKDFHDGQGSGSLRDAHYDQADLHVVLGSVDFDDLSTADPTGRTTALKGMIAAAGIAVTSHPSTTDKDATPLDFKIAHMAVVGVTPAPGAIPSELAVAIDHLTFPVGDATATTRALGEMGYPSLDLSTALAAKYDATAERLSVEKLAISGAGMGTATLVLQLTNAGKALASPDAEAAKAAAEKLLVKSLDLRLENAGLFERAIAWKAKNDGIGVADERALGVDYFVHTFPAAIGGGNAKVLGAAIGAFIAEPRTLHVVATSKTGVGADDVRLLATPDVLLDSLDLRATANE